MKFTSAALALATVGIVSANTLEGSCSASQRTAFTNANQACASMASAAADAAESGSEETFQTFFKDTSQSTRQAVAASFRKVAKECSSTPGGTSKSYCTDQHGNCGGGLLGYTYWQNTYSGSVGSTYYCPIYYSTIPATGVVCDDQSQASNTLHETTHAVLATRDIAYGLRNVKALSSSDALHNADSYTYYAIAIELKCDESSSGQSYSPVGGGSLTRRPYRLPWWLGGQRS